MSLFVLACFVLNKTGQDQFQGLIQGNYGYYECYGWHIYVVFQPHEVNFFSNFTGLERVTVCNENLQQL